MRYHRVRLRSARSAHFRGASRLAWPRAAAAAVWLVLTITFALIRLAPGDAATFLVPPAATRGRRRAPARRARPRPVDRRSICTLAARHAARRSRRKLRRSADRCERCSRDALPVSLGLGGASLAAHVPHRRAGRADAGRATRHARSISTLTVRRRSSRRGAELLARRSARSPVHVLASSLEPAALDAAARVRHARPAPSCTASPHLADLVATCGAAGDASRRGRRRGHRALRAHRARSTCWRRLVRTARAKGARRAARAVAASRSRTCARRSSCCSRCRCPAPSRDRSSSRRCSRGRAWVA